MRTPYKLIVIALLILGIAACNKPAGNKTDGQVLATVNGTPITEATLRAFVRSRANGQEPQLNAEQQTEVVKTLVNIEVLAQAARKQGVDRQPDTQADMALSENDILAQMLVQNYLKQHAPTDAQIKAAYDEKVKGFDTHQYKARHILVKDEGQAKDIIAQLDKGANFATLAKKYSVDPGSAANGGDLGDWFSGSSMVPEFSAALAKLKKGQITQQPVHTQYGYHVIQLEDEREQPAPSMAQMHDQIADALQRKAVDDYVKQLTDASKVVYSTPAQAMTPPAVSTKP